MGRGWNMERIPNRLSPLILVASSSPASPLIPHPSSLAQAWTSRRGHVYSIPSAAHPGLATRIDAVIGGMRDEPGMATTDIVIRGAREHNLRDVVLDLPRDKLIGFTGVSGSGKSSLAFDTLYAEGQRRYVETLSSYARQFLGQMPKPDVDQIGGLSPSISIQQKTAGRNPRSTVGTITEIYDYLRVLYARVGQGHCPKCGRPITAQTREQIVAPHPRLPEGTPFLGPRPGRPRAEGRVQGPLRRHGAARATSGPGSTARSSR